jgi:hypothetical protein
VTVSGDDVPGMSPAQPLDDAAVEAIVRGAGPADVPPELRDLATFAAQVRAAVGPPPRPSAELTRIIAGGGRADGVSRLRAVQSGPSGRGRHAAPRSPGRVVGVRAVAKVCLGATAAVVVVGASAAAALPGEAGRAVRNAIELVTPADFFPGEEDRGPHPPRDDVPGEDVRPDVDAGPGGGHPADSGGTVAHELGDDGDDVSADATGDPDGDGGEVEDVSDHPPGAEHPAPWGPGDPGWPPHVGPPAQPDDMQNPGDLDDGDPDDGDSDEGDSRVSGTSTTSADDPDEGNERDRRR